MILFHASTTHYETGAKLIAQERSVDRFNAEFESELAIHAPDGMGDRVSSVFATETAALAARYLEAEGMWEGPLYLYEVRAESKSRHPMALIDIAAKESKLKVFNGLPLSIGVQPDNGEPGSISAIGRKFFVNLVGHHLLNVVSPLSTIDWIAVKQRASIVNQQLLLDAWLVAPPLVPVCWLKFLLSIEG
jgi:hypothetical protein